MLVYGRQDYQERLSSLLEHLHSHTARTRGDSIEELRELVIQAGQLEQGIEDFRDAGNQLEPQLVQRIQAITERTATAFYLRWAGARKECPAPCQDVGSALKQLTRELDSLCGAFEAVLTIRIPEGFEYYGLFPEQHCVSALKWAGKHIGTWPKRVAVVGIRTIGTTLSAVAAVVLAAKGWQVTRLTVRPVGHPFARRVELGPLPLGETKCGLVVDEGPGLSGSSMAATARALAEAGIQDISFLPGHEGEPGSAASLEIRRWWGQTPRYVTRLDELSWNGLSLAESLAARTEQLGEEPPRAERHAEKRRPRQQRTFEDLSGGLWRKKAFANEADWPASCARFERMKFLCSAANGIPIVWKFTGLGCAWRGGKTSSELALEQMAFRAKEGLVPAPLGTFRGFIALPWVAGRRLHPNDSANPAVMVRLGTYLLRATGPPLSVTEAAASWSRLTGMLYTNTKEAFGEEYAERSCRWAERVRGLEPAGTYGDGRLAPYEWVETPAGEMLKTDCTGHELDHTLIGRQPLLWDIAGAFVEWNLKWDSAYPLLELFSKSRISIEPEALSFYAMAYAAFRMGLTSFCASQLPADSAEQRGLQKAAGFYRRKLECLINSSQFPGSGSAPGRSTGSRPGG